MVRTPSPDGRTARHDERAAPFRLVHEGKEFPLEPGQYVLGRATACDVVLDDALVSRRHARIIANETTALIEDLRSENGVFVNERRVRRSVRLEDGDRIVVGRMELVLHAVPVGSFARSSGQRPTLQEPSNPALVPLNEHKDTLSTLEADAFDYLGQLADRMLAMGRARTAERMLSGPIREVLEAARSGRPIDRPILDATTRNAVKLAEALRDVTWIHCVLELHVIVGQPMCASATATIQKLLPQMPNLSRPLVQGYQRALLASLHRLTKEELPLAHAILALEV